jgi:hypothetical protein
MAKRHAASLIADLPQLRTALLGILLLALLLRVALAFQCNPKLV